MRRLGLLAWLFGTCLWSGCANDFTTQSEVVLARIMGTRIEVQGDTQRATANLGESAVLRVQVGFPENPLPMNLAGVVCVSVTLPNGTRYCVQELADVRAAGEPEQPDEVDLPFSIPSLEDLEAAFGNADLPDGQDLFVGESELPELVLFGALCVQGTPRRRADTSVNDIPLADLFRCRRPDPEVDFPDPIPFTKTLFTGGPANLNPGLPCRTDVPNTCRGAPDDDGPRVLGDMVLVRPLPKDAPDDAEPEVIVWTAPPDDLPDESFKNCRNNPALEPFQATVGQDDYLIRLRFDSSDREKLPDDPDRPAEVPDIEELVVYGALTEDGGELDNPTKLIGADEADDAMEVEFEYSPPGDNGDVQLPFPKGGRVIRFYFTVYDGRGGADFTTRALCLLPAKE